MSPIRGLTESRRWPRLGKIHLGIKKQSVKSGAFYPSATDYFVVPPEVAEVVGEKPTELPILFPNEDDEKFASQFYRSYSMTRGLVCRGDGETCRRMVDAQTGELANRDSTDILWKDELPCEGQDCPYYGKQCKEVMNLQFLLPTVEGLGIWQIDTSSINSIKNINSAIELIRGVYGRIAMIPLLLTLEPIPVVNPDDGKKKTVRVLNLRIKGTMMELMQRTLKPAREMLLPVPLDTEAPEDMLPVPDDQVPELIMPQNQVPEEEIFSEEAEPELGTESGLDFDADWLLDSLKEVHWTDVTVKSYCKNIFRVDTENKPLDTSLELVPFIVSLKRQDREALFKKIQDQLQMVQV